MQLAPILSPNEQYNMHTFSILIIYPGAQLLQSSTELAQTIHLGEQKFEQLRTTGSAQAGQNGFAHKLQESEYLQDVHQVVQSLQTDPSKY
jgi:hypothetical protein